LKANFAEVEESIKFNENCSYSVEGAAEVTGSVMCISNFGIYLLKEIKNKKKTDYELQYAWGYNQIISEPRINTIKKDNSQVFIFGIPQEKSFFSGFFGLWGNTAIGTDTGETPTGDTATGDCAEVVIKFSKQSIKMCLNL
jgi:hypothetical protein